ncbi:hypothetical protein BJY52DRAFT_1230820 [Lactarius psammicola]|nr:hypothetical protein BJY52DRAFT_1230820 [Lactarius psammicola]
MTTYADYSFLTPKSSPAYSSELPTPPIPKLYQGKTPRLYGKVCAERKKSRRKNIAYYYETWGASLAKKGKVSGRQGVEKGPPSQRASVKFRLHTWPPSAASLTAMGVRGPSIRWGRRKSQACDSTDFWVFGGYDGVLAGVPNPAFHPPSAPWKGFNSRFAGVHNSIRRLLVTRDGPVQPRRGCRATVRGVDIWQFRTIPDCGLR